MGVSGSQRPRRVDELAGPVGNRFVPPSPLPIMLRRGEQDTQKRQCPGTSGPGWLDDQHQTEPAQATTHLGRPFRGADGIMLDAPFADMRAPAPFQGFINDQLDGRASGNERADQPQEKHSAHAQG
jgi:hypothetical protein